MLNNCKLSYRVEGFFIQISSSFMRYSLQLDGSKRSRPSTSLHASKNLLTLVSSSLGISQGTSNLPVLGKVQGSNFFGFLNLLLVRLDFALELVNKSLHTFMVLLVLISSKGQLLDLALSLAQVLGRVTKPPALSIKLGFKLSDSGLHLHHGLFASLKGIHLSLISTRLGILALSLKKLAVLLQVHGKVLLSTELISKSCSINHGSSSLLLRQLCFTAHFIQISINGAEFILKLPFCCSNSLVLVSQVSKSLIRVSKLLFQAPPSPISLLKHGASFLKAVLHSSSLPISINLGILSSSLKLRLLINLDLGITDLVLVFLDGSLCLKGSSISMLKGKIKVSHI